MSTDRAEWRRSATWSAIMSPRAPAAPTIVAIPFMVGGDLKPHQSSHSPPTEAHKGNIEMTPKDILTLLQIVDLSAKSPAYSQITAVAHAALVDAQLHVLAKADNDDDDEEKSSSPPSRAAAKR